MRKKLSVFSLPVLLILSQLGSFPFFSGAFVTEAQAAPAPEREWTFLVYLNGNNNLDSFGTDDLNEMEQVGSTDKVNVVVQWASLEEKKVRRLLVKKDSDTKKVTSPIIQDMGTVDMGDWHSLVEFIRWGKENFPAKHYFVDVWDHGSGWHAKAARGLKPNDISWDDISGNFMTTQQLGQAITEGASILGQKLDIYGSDACLMTMLEVAGEMSSSVGVFVGSEEVEPAEGWPYDALLRRWNALSSATAADVGKILTEEYVKSYSGGSQGTRENTFSALDLSKMDKVNAAVAELGKNLKTFSDDDRKKATSAASKTEYFTYRDYGDLLDFTANLKSSAISRLDTRTVKAVEDAAHELIIANKGSSTYAKAKGVAIWLPTAHYSYEAYSEKYADLAFQKDTDWSSALDYMLKGTDDDNGDGSGEGRGGNSSEDDGQGSALIASH